MPNIATRCFIMMIRPATGRLYCRLLQVQTTTFYAFCEHTLLFSVRRWLIYNDICNVMCARFTIRKVKKLVGRLEPIKVEADLNHPRYNVAPSQNVPVCLIRDEQRVIMELRWGLIPSWADDPAIGNRLINARAETLDAKPSFRHAFRRRRCLVLADGFYEWQNTETGKYPIYIQVDQGEPFAFAGLYERWERQGQNPIMSCTIITTASNELMKPIHDRMPAILPEERYEQWIDPAITDTAELQGLLKAIDADRMNAFPVSRYVNSPAHDDEQCIKPA